MNAAVVAIVEVEVATVANELSALKQATLQWLRNPIQVFQWGSVVAQQACHSLEL
jgi:hypothetical protein